MRAIDDKSPMTESEEQFQEKLASIQQQYESRAEELAENEESQIPEHPLFEGLTLDEALQAKRKKSFRRISQWLNSNPARLVVFSFLLVIFLGGLLLALPVSNRRGEATHLLTAFFTSTSATCVTGLVVVDTMTHWSGFGQFVIISLIQIGGLSLLTILSAFGMGLHRRIHLNTARALQESTASYGFNDTFSLVKRIVALTLATEAIGAVILVANYTRYMDFVPALKKGAFQAVSAYCNAGFDLMGDYSGPFSSLTAFRHDPVVLLTTAFLFISGGLGFVVWVDLFSFRQERRLRFHTKLVLGMTLALLAAGTISFLILESANHDAQHLALGDLPWGQRILNAFFQSATLRTAGFNSINQSSLSDSSKMIGSVLMMIGAGPASTGGGIKVSTAAIVLAGVMADLSGKNDGSVLARHRLKQDVIRRSFSIFFVALCLIFLVALIIFIGLPVDLRGKISFVDAFYEASSAFGTVGVTSISTPQLGFADRLAIMANMFLGRVGPASFALSLITMKSPVAKKVLPEGRTFVG